MGSLVKSLEIQGYKTFASSTEFKFADTVTAIVGPNGSGKSNIVDALRWVLGEQSYSLLRGKKTEDMIFAGSEQRARAGMASATLTFSNESEWLPIDFSEVAITRRAYRDGQNEYVLNGQRVRLKDVSELLSKSGLSERTYTIIGQGLVDAALSLKAEERRKLFEEAAGIGLYRSRREESLRRLETTKRNIERVQDILTELRPLLRSLERQAEKAREFERMKTDLRVILREWYGYHWHLAQKDLVLARESTSGFEVSLGDAKRLQGKIDTQLNSVRSVISELREKLKIWRRKAADLQLEREKLRREIAVADERIRSHQQQYENVKLELLRAEPELEQRELLLLKANDYLERQRRELKEAQNYTTNAIEELQAAQALKLDTENELIGVRRNLSELFSRNSYLEATLAGLTEQIDVKKNEIITIGLSLQEIEDDYSKNKKTLEQNTLILDTIFLQKDSVEEQIKRLAVERKSKEANLNELFKRHSVYENERERLLSQMDLIEKSEKALTGFARGASKVMRHENLIELKERIGVLRDIVEIPQELDTAITAALGDYLDVVILETDKNIEDILLTLEKEGVRGALLPLNRLYLGKKKISAIAQRGVIGIASDLVVCPSKIRPAIELLLDGVIVVEKRQIAQHIVANLREETAEKNERYDNLRVVTLEGEVFYLSGTVLGGKENRVPGVKIGQQLAQNQSNIKEIEQKSSEIEELLRAENVSLENINAKEIQLGKELEEVRQTEKDKREKSNQTIFEFERSNAHIELLNKQRIGMEIAIRDDEKQVPEIEEQITQINTLIEQEQALIQQEEEKFDISHPLTKLQDKVTHWKTKQAVLERGIQDTKRQIEERIAISERASADFIALKNRMAELESSKILVQTHKKQIGENEIKISEGLSKLKQVIESNEQTLLEKEHQQQDLIIKDSEARQTLNLAEHQYAQARITLAQRHESMETLKHRIEDDFGLVSYEYTEGISGPRPLPIEGMVEQLPIIEELSPDIEDNLRIQRAALRRLGAINPEARSEYHEIRDRFQFLTEQIRDLQEAEKDIREVISELDELMEREFYNTFTEVAEEFGFIFTRLFGGGSARLVLTNPDDLTETGIDIEARLPGRREQGLSLLSGGERSLAATSLVFALLKVSPTPFCVLDEVDAMLDESNTGRFRDLLNELSQNTQFVVITHNRNTVQVADVIYGVTMGRDSSSQVISLKMDEVMEVVR